MSRIPAIAVLAALAAGLALAIAAAHPVRSVSPPPAALAPVAAPATLRATGLYADWEGKVVAADSLPYAPQYPLWSDGARKRRWIRIPPGAAIDGARPDAWEFPVGTRLWKEFAFGGRRVETRYMERTAAGWIYASYAWSPDQGEALLAPARGLPDAAAIAPGLSHAIPGQGECRACHEGATPVLGFSALQLSPDRDPGAPHAETPPPGAIDLAALVRRRLVRGLPASLLVRPPRIAAKSATERAALGYLHGNCGGCHNPASSLAPLGMSLAYVLDGTEPAAIATTFARPSRFAPAGHPGALRVAPGRPDDSVLLARMRSRSAISQMPPLGTRLVDDEAARLIDTWIREAAGRSGEASGRQ